MTDNLRSPTLSDPETIRHRIRRYYLFLVLNRDPATRKVLQDLIKQAKAQLSASLSSERLEPVTSKLGVLHR